MCGVVGYLETQSRVTAEAEARIRAMARTLSHRGPDGDGFYTDIECGIALGHRRLSIIELSQAGAQPMTSHDGRWILTFNGEIYNFDEMRRILEQRCGPICWRGCSDTEVLLQAFSVFGVEKSLQLANGMFAFGLWDRRDRVLYLARDRMGEKPLYYGWQGSVFLFGSELKALAAHPEFQRRPNQDAIALYLRYAYVPAPFSIYAGVHKLPPGRFIAMPAATPPGNLPEPVAYWTLPVPKPQPCEDETAAEELDSLLRDSVRMRMRADVPMGAFLSGGVDSSAVVSLMQAQSAEAIRTFSIGFREDGYDESVHARRIAGHLGTEHTELTVSGADALSVVPMLPQIYDEPFADSSQIPTHLLSKLTRQHVTVSLSGDAGDEVFAGYARYFTFGSLWPLIERVPRPLRAGAAAALSAVPQAAWSRLRSFMPEGIGQEIRAERLAKFAMAARAPSMQHYFASLVQFWDPAEILTCDREMPTVFFDRYDIERDFSDPALGMSFVDMGSYLPDDILVKVDRATMAASLEARVPLLDHRLIEFAATLPASLKIREGRGKWLLRHLLDRHVPRELIDRPKQGFAIPLSEWLRGPLREWSESLLNDETGLVGDVLNRSTLRKVWQSHQSGQRDESRRLWVVLMLLAWAREWRPV